jgi:hypothetical protein
VVELATTISAGFNQQHLTELLNEEHELAVSRLERAEAMTRDLRQF